MDSKKALTSLYIVGPTASGKTALSLDIAKQLGAEIVCADSQTVRKKMDIGTAKPTMQEREDVPHYMLSIIDPYADYTLAEFQSMAKDIIFDIHKRNKLAIIAGGTGLYIDSLFFDFRLPQLSGELEVERYQEMSAEELRELVVKRGYQLPANSQNKRHLINVLRRAGTAGENSPPDPRSLIVGINPSRELLIERINARVDAMFESGFIGEVRDIVKKYGRPPREFDAIGYRIVLRLLDGEISEPEARELIKIADRQYAKRQISWFRRNPHIRWFESPDEAKRYILDTC